MGSVSALRRREIIKLFGAATLASLGPTGALAQGKTVRLGVLRLASAGPVFVATEKGYLRDEGLAVELKFFDAAQPIAVAVTSGDVDLGVTAFTGGLFNLAGKGQMKIVAAQSREEPGFPLSPISPRSRHMRPASRRLPISAARRSASPRSARRSTIRWRCLRRNSGSR